MSARLDGKVILVTGAALGIGAATARLAAVRGARVIVTDRDGDGAAAVAAEVGVTAFPLDVTKPAEWNRVLRELPRVDGLVYCAGVLGDGPIVDLDLEVFRRLTAVHVEGAFLGLQRVVAKMRAAGTPAHGSLVTVSSSLASHVAKGAAPYGTVKAALTNMTRAIAVELGRKGDLIRANSIAPGAVDKPFARRADPTLFDDAAAAALPLGAHPTVADCAEAIVFLLSDEAAFVTGTELPIDSGRALL